MVGSKPGSVAGCSVPQPLAKTSPRLRASKSRLGYPRRRRSTSGTAHGAILPPGARRVHMEPGRASDRAEMASGLVGDLARARGRLSSTDADPLQARGKQTSLARDEVRLHVSRTFARADTPRARGRSTDAFDGDARSQAFTAGPESVQRVRADLPSGLVGELARSPALSTSDAPGPARSETVTTSPADRCARRRAAATATYPARARFQPLRQAAAGRPARWQGIGNSAVDGGLLGAGLRLWREPAPGGPEDGRRGGRHRPQRAAIGRSFRRQDGDRRCRVSG